MGRYDKIKVFNGSTWKKPNKIQVYNGTSWISLGTDDDKTNTKSIQVHNGTKLQVATKKWKTWQTTKDGDTYTVGAYHLSDGNLQYCPNSSISRLNTNFQFKCTMKKDSNVDQQVYKTAAGGGAGTYLTITWLADGRIKVAGRYSSGTEYTLYSNHYVYAGSWVSLDVYQNAGSNTMHIVINSQETTGNMFGAFAVTNGWNIAGDSVLHFKGVVDAKGGNSNGGNTEYHVNVIYSTASLYTEKITVTNGDWE